MNLPGLQSWVLLFFFKTEVPVKLRQGIDPTEVSLFPAEGQEDWEQEDSRFHPDS